MEAAADPVAVASLPEGVLAQAGASPQEAVKRVEEWPTEESEDLPAGDLA